MVGSGVPPTLMSDEVQATFDLTPFYGAGLLASDGINDTAQNIGDKWTFRVASGSSLVLLAAQANVTIAAAEDAIVAIGIEDKSGGFVRIAAMNRMIQIPSAAPANTRMGIGVALEHPVVLTAGEGLSGILDSANLVAARATTLNVMGYFFSS